MLKQDSYLPVSGRDTPVFQGLEEAALRMSKPHEPAKIPWTSAPLEPLFGTQGLYGDIQGPIQDPIQEAHEPLQGTQELLQDQGPVQFTNLSELLLVRPEPAAVESQPTPSGVAVSNHADNEAAAAVPKPKRRAARTRRPSIAPASSAPPPRTFMSHREYAMSVLQSQASRNSQGMAQVQPSMYHYMSYAPSIQFNQSNVNLGLDTSGNAYNVPSGAGQGLASGYGMNYGMNVGDNTSFSISPVGYNYNVAGSYQQPTFPAPAYSMPYSTTANYTHGPYMPNGVSNVAHHHVHNNATAVSWPNVPDPGSDTSGHDPQANTQSSSSAMPNSSSGGYTHVPTPSNPGSQQPNQVAH